MTETDANTTLPDEISYDDKLKFCSVIAQPMASKKLCKKVYKLIKKSWKKKQMCNGVKAVQKALRKDVKGKPSICRQFEANSPAIRRQFATNSPTTLLPVAAR